MRKRTPPDHGRSTGFDNISLGRKNWLFCGSDNGGHTAAVLFSLIATCQRHKTDPFAYLRDVLGRIAATPVSQLPQLLPDRWKP